MKLNKIIAIITIVICIIVIGIGVYKYKENKDYQEALIEQTRFIKYFKTKSSIDGLKISNKDFIDKSINSKVDSKNELKQSHVKNNKYIVIYKFNHKDSKGTHNIEVDAYYYKNPDNTIVYKANNLVFKQDKKVIDADWAISIALYDYYKGSESSGTDKTKSMIQNVINLKNKYKDLDLTDLSKTDADNTIKKDELAIAEEKAKEEEHQRERAEEEEQQREKEQAKERESDSINSNAQSNSNSNVNMHPSQAEIDAFRKMWIEDQVKWAEQHKNEDVNQESK